MALPTISELRRPVLQVHQDGETKMTAEIIEALVPVFSITDEELASTQNSGDNTMVQRVGWARNHLLRQGMLEQPAHGAGRITERGRAALASGEEIGPPRSDWAASPVSREAVLAAIAEFDRDGHDTVLRRHGYRQALDYSVVHEGQLYAAKGLYGVAHTLQYPDDEPIRNRGISSGREVAAKLESIGFTVQSRSERGVRVWLIRAGYSGQYETLAVTERVALIGWSDLGPIGLHETREDLKRRVGQTFNEPRAASVAVQAGQIYRFIHEVKAGDLVVLPLKSRPRHVAVGRMMGAYVHRDDGPFAGTDAQHTREVDWLATDLPYERFEADLRDAFGQQGTLSEITKPDAAQRLLDVVGGEDASAVHVVLKAAPADWGGAEADGLPEAAVEQLRGQLEDGSTTTVFLHQDDATWRSRLTSVLAEGDAVLFELADVERAEASEITDDYILAATGEPLTASGLGDATPLLVRRGSAVTTGRYFVVDATVLVEGELVWDTATTGAVQLLAQSPGARFVVFDGGYAGSGEVTAIATEGDRHRAAIEYATFERRVPPTEGPERSAQLAIGQITPAQFDRLLELGRGGAAFGVDSVTRYANARGLSLDPRIYAQIVAALTSGKHVILTGPPGTAKTTLAGAVADAAKAAGQCDGFLLTTATADWTTYETIGGLRPTANELQFEEGHFLAAIRDSQWLVIDELNRSHFDRAFGQLFTVLSGQAVVLPYKRPGATGSLALVPEGVPAPADGLDVLEIPQSWRVIATMNVFDKSLLFEMSFALMRRFAFIEVGSPSDAVFETLIEKAAGNPRAARIAKQLLDLRELTDFGPAVFMDLAKYLRQRVALTDDDDGQLVYEAFYSYLLPQFEGIDAVRGARLFELVGARLGGDDRRERLRRTLNAVLGLEL